MPEINNALKTISSTPEELRVGNYIVLFGGRDKSGEFWKNPNGTKGEYFTKETELESSYTKTGFIHVDFEHGQDPDEVGITSDDVLGYVDWKTAKVDDAGVFVERVLNRRQRYVQWLESLVDEGLVGNSTEAVSDGVERTDDGEIKRWPLRRDTLTVNPMEPRMLSENAMISLKSLAKELPYFKSLITPLSADAEVVEQKTEQTTIKEEVTMTEEEIKAMLEGVADSAVKKYAESKEPEAKADYQIEVVEDEADKAARLNPFKSAGELLKAVRLAELQPASIDKRLLPMKATGLNEAIPSDGGFLVQQDIAGGILQNMWGTGSVLSRFPATPVQGNGMVFNVLDESSRADGYRGGGVQGYWLAEAAEKTKSKPKFRQLSLKLKKVAALCYATDELLEDAGALETWLTNEVPNELRFQVEQSILNGNGVGKPLGILQSPALLSLARVDANEIDATDVANMWAHRYAGANDYVWFVSSTIFPQLVNLTIGQVPMYFPPGGLGGMPYGTLLGKPVIETEYNPSLGILGDIMLVSPSQYKLISKGGVQAASSIHVKFTTDEMTFRWVYRVDGAPEWSSTVASYYASSDTISPFVALTASS